MSTSIREQTFADFFALFDGVTHFALKARMSNFRLDQIKETPALIQIDGALERFAGDGASGDIAGVQRVVANIQVYLVVREQSPPAIGPALSEAWAQVMLAANNKWLSAVQATAVWNGDAAPNIDDEEGASPTGELMMNFQAVFQQRDIDPYVIT